MDKRYFEKVWELLKSPEIGLSSNKFDFNGARRAVFNSPKLLELMRKNGIRETFEISSGVSDEKAYGAYLKQATEDLVKGKYYRSYYPNVGDPESRNALAYYENLKFGNNPVYSMDDFCLTEGSTGAISAIIEYIARTYPGSQVLITNPCYYLYRSACRFYGIAYKEVNLFSKARDKKISFTSIKNIIVAINNKTKLIIINNPFNPSGEIYAKEDIAALLKLARKQNALLLVDELFQDLVFDKKTFIPSDKVARDQNSLTNLVIVKGYSKNKNLVALRLGYLFSKNKELIENVAKINQVRQSFPSASNYGGLIVLDAFIQSVLFANKNNLASAVNKTYQTFPKTPTLGEKSKKKLVLLAAGYKEYYDNLMMRYSQSYDMCIRLLEKDISYRMPKVSAFNTFVRIPYLDSENMFDFTLNLYITTGVKIEIGPCFGFSQKEWETSKDLGFWLRITFAKNKKVLNTGIEKFIGFARSYIQKKNSMLVTNLSF